MEIGRLWEVSLLLFFCNISTWVKFSLRLCVFCRVSDPYSFDPDPDPAFEAGDQSGSKALMTKNLKKSTAGNFFFFWSKTAIYRSLGLHKVCPSYRRSLQLSKEAIQHFKTWTFTNFFLLLWVTFALLDPDPDPLARLNPDPIRIRIWIWNPVFFV